MGLPGSLPRLNQKAVESATSIAMALSCETPEKIAFFRKNYFYPDLPKNFQITQLNVYGDMSIGGEGYVNVEDKKIKIRRIQLEEDPGRIIYEGASERTKITLIDYNRAGTPLVEIVTDPDFESPRQVRVFLNILSDLLENLGVAEPGLEGAMRADGNVSIEGGKKVEIKNIGSFHDLEKALHFEITRQQSLFERDIEIVQETRHWDDKRKITVSSRSKEEDQDYRYFLENDIPWVKIDQSTRDTLKQNMPESISSKKERYMEKYNIASQVAEIIASDKYYSNLFENAYSDSNAKDIANLITTDVIGFIDTKEKQQNSKITSKHLSELIDAINSKTITRNSAKVALQEIMKSGKGTREVLEELDLGQVSDSSEIENIISQIFEEEKQAVIDAKERPETVNFLVGKVMQKTKGKADPVKTLELIKSKLGQ
jgi:aspartyl-tRNA(Asn)/glutamyl-tRNA(Gln) amidotransferase subunit B